MVLSKSSEPFEISLSHLSPGKHEGAQDQLCIGKARVNAVQSSCRLASCHVTGQRQYVEYLAPRPLSLENPIFLSALAGLEC